MHGSRTTGAGDRTGGAIAGIIAFIATGILAGVAGATIAAPVPPPMETAVQLGPEDAAFVGQQRCRLCHQDTSVRFQTDNPHQSVVAARGNASVSGCETCHGGGAQHVSSMNPEMIGRFGQGDPLTESEVCLGCHAEGPSHVNRFVDPHQENGIACTSCHSIHEPALATPLLGSAPNALCNGCHPTEGARFLQPFAHPVDTIRADTSIVECIDCHSAHGGTEPNSLNSDHANQTACLGCHSDKRGPFAFEHLPMVTSEGCTSCHQPHGSPNPRMLVRSSVASLCLECHTSSPSAFGASPPAFHDLRSMRYQNCTLCHTQIHGSHSSPALLR